MVALVIVVVVKVVRLGPAATVPPITVAPRFSLGVRDERQGLQEGA
jgi:hypothetical protein